MRNQMAMACLFAGILFPFSLQAQTTAYGRSGKWTVTQTDGNQCWMTRGTDVSLLTLARFKNRRAGIGFSIDRSGPLPKLIPVAVDFMNVPFAKEKVSLRKTFTKVVTRGVTAFYQAEFSESELSLLRSHGFVSFTEIPTFKDPYSHIGVANSIYYEAAAERMLEQCVNTLK